MTFSKLQMPSERNSAISPGAMELSPEAAASLMQSLQEARAMIRAVILAEAASKDQSIDWGPGNGGPDRWSPVVSEVCRRISSSRDIVINTCKFNSLDWPTFLSLAEALDAALWNQMIGGSDDELASDELVAIARVLVSLLDDALDVCIAEGVPTRSAMH